MTHYKTLGVEENASADEIKQAYRKLASQNHPDKGGDKGKFQEIQAAYSVLSDDQKRQQYDMERTHQDSGIRFHFHGGMPHNIDEIFKNFGFGGDPFAHMRAQAQPRRNKDLRIEIPIPLVSTLEEQTKTIQVKTTSGDASTLEVKIPRGVTSGTNIKYSGLGDNLFSTLPRGDLYVQFNVHPAENFHVNNIDLYRQVQVNCLLAITGGMITVTGLDNKKFELSLPKGIQPGTRFRLPEQGLYQLNTNHRGDLYVEITITVPTDLTDTQLETIQSINTAK
jgi:DnaJ-class molecular chaperone